MDQSISVNNKRIFFGGVVSAIKCFLLFFSTKKACNDYMHNHSELIKPDFLLHKKLPKNKNKNNYYYIYIIPS
jgi:hypothetical protein